jgi:CTP:molybdopterin cytidylyltransferase MocA
MGTPTTRVAGIVLAAGGGTRAGGPKALRRDTTGMPWLAHATAALREGGCATIIVVLGAEAEQARDLVPPGVAVVVAEDWADGLSASLRAGLAAAAAHDATAALITLVDLPGLPAAAVARLLAEPLTSTTLRRALYAGRPGHPVVIGREHWGAVAASATGDRGAGSYVKAQGAESIDCSDLWGGADVDTPDVDGAETPPP